MVVQISEQPLLCSIEYDKDTYSILKHNVENVYDVKNATLFQGDTTLFMKDKEKLKEINFNIDSYCLCLDPPWTGIFYKTHQTLDLFLSNINIIDFIKDLTIRYVCIKAPNNYNFAALYKHFYNIVIHRLGGFYFILIDKQNK